MAAVFLLLFASCLRQSFPNHAALIAGFPTSVVGRTSALQGHLLHHLHGFRRGLTARLQAESDTAETTQPERTYWMNLTLGQEVSGTVKKVTPQGAWLDIGASKSTGGGRMALVELSEWLEEGGFPADYQKVKDSKGTTISARILRLKSGGQIFLTRRPGNITRPDVFRVNRTRGMQFADLRIVAGFKTDYWQDAQIVGFAPWGVYCGFRPSRDKPGCRVEGLLHTTHFADGFAAKAAVGDRIKVRILEVDVSKGTLALTMRQPAQSQKADAET